MCWQGTAEEVLEKAEETIDLYLLDVSMPAMSGFSAGSPAEKALYGPDHFSDGVFRGI